MGKYIIEVNDEYVSPDNELIVSHKNLFDGCSYHIQIAKLTPYTEPDIDAIKDEAYQQGRSDGRLKGYNEGYDRCFEKHNLLNIKESYQKGLSDMHECVKKIFGNEIPPDDLVKMFGSDPYSLIGKILEVYSATEIIERIRAYEYEQEKKDIKVGDEVLYEDEKGVVIVPEENGHYAAAFTAGGMRICEPDYKLRKTGKHYPEIVKILQEMRKK